MSTNQIKWRNTVIGVYNKFPSTYFIFKSNLTSCYSMSHIHLIFKTFQLELSIFVITTNTLKQERPTTLDFRPSLYSLDFNQCLVVDVQETIIMSRECNVSIFYLFPCETLVITVHATCSIISLALKCKITQTHKVSVKLRVPPA